MKQVRLRVCALDPDDQTSAMAGTIPVQRAWLSCLPALAPAPGCFRGYFGLERERGREKVMLPLQQEGRQEHCTLTAAAAFKNRITQMQIGDV